MPFRHQVDFALGQALGDLEVHHGAALIKFYLFVPFLVKLHHLGVDLLFTDDDPGEAILDVLELPLQLDRPELEREFPVRLDMEFRLDFHETCRGMLVVEEAFCFSLFEVEVNFPPVLGSEEGLKVENAYAALAVLVPVVPNFDSHDPSMLLPQTIYVELAHCLLAGLEG